jgi:hypothetical protein
MRLDLFGLSAILFIINQKAISTVFVVVLFGLLTCVVTDYNLSTALRQVKFEGPLRKETVSFVAKGSMEKYFSLLLYLPIAIFADSETMKFFSDINVSYQFWVHTEGWNDKFLLLWWFF